METKSFLVVFDDWFHLKVSLIANYVVYFLKSDGGEDSVEDFLQRVNLEPRQKWSCVVNVLNKGVVRVSVCPNC